MGSAKNKAWTKITIEKVFGIHLEGSPKNEIISQAYTNSD